MARRVFWEDLGFLGLEPNLSMAAGGLGGLDGPRLAASFASRRALRLGQAWREIGIPCEALRQDALAWHCQSQAAGNATPPRTVRPMVPTGPRCLRLRFALVANETQEFVLDVLDDLGLGPIPTDDDTDD
jgi:hypothetical protein